MSVGGNRFSMVDTHHTISVVDTHHTNQCGGYT